VPDRSELARRLAALTLAAALAGCGGRAGVPAAEHPTAAFPEHVADFQRVEIVPPQHPGGSITVGYERVLDSGSVIATVQARQPHDAASLLPALDRNASRPEVAARELVRSEAQVRRFYKAARLIDERDAFLAIAAGTLRGRAASIEFDALLDAAPQPIRLDIYVFCCSRAGEVYEYRFRHAAGVDGGLAIAEFMRQLDWPIAPPP
jgi:hypothetical protein